ncbi:hypothetical protein [Streptosporangium sp. NPDC049078]|uniref:hypothetical protein n=1 Tax=Streptosporangium sp. NPDC049078 TaxID=3155767 RepID=UPI00342CCC00
MSDTDPMRESLAWFKYLDQGETWVPNGKPALPITDMDITWRHNASQWLLRQAKPLAWRYGMGELAFIYGTTAPTLIPDETGHPVPGPDVAVFAPMGEMAQEALERELDDAQEERDADPEAWLKSTPLYLALVDGLPENAAELAKHWSACDLRTGQGATCSCTRSDISSAGTDT